MYPPTLTLFYSPDPFYSRALRVYIDQFEFRDIPLDVALRKLLMEVGLPRETQQIDRVMEAFASRYMGCNSDIFTSEGKGTFSLQISLLTSFCRRPSVHFSLQSDYVAHGCLQSFEQTQDEQSRLHQEY